MTFLAFLPVGFRLLKLHGIVFIALVRCVDCGPTSMVGCCVPRTDCISWRCVVLVVRDDGCVRNAEKVSRVCVYIYEDMNTDKILKNH